MWTAAIISSDENFNYFFSGRRPRVRLIRKPGRTKRRPRSFARSLVCQLFLRGLEYCVWLTKIAQNTAHNRPLFSTTLRYHWHLALAGCAAWSRTSLTLKLISTSREHCVTCWPWAIFGPKALWSSPVTSARAPTGSCARQFKLLSIWDYWSRTPAGFLRRR